MKYAVTIHETIEVEADSHAHAVKQAAWEVLDDIQAGTRRPDVLTLEAHKRLYFPSPLPEPQGV